MDSKTLFLIVIVGPTAAGKSELAVRLAKKFNGEIISADSRQIYRGLDIGTGKVAGKWVKKNVPSSKRSRITWNIFIHQRIPHYCIDFVSPKKTFTVAEYKKCAETAIRDIAGRGKLPILAGGTGFWIDSVVYDLNLPAVPPNPPLRKRLEKKSARELLKILQKLDPERAETVEEKNPRRLIRAIEIAKAIGRVPKLRKRPPYRTLWIGLNPPGGVLEKRIKARIKKMIAAGLIAEVKNLLRKGLHQKRIREFGFEYRAGLAYLEGQLALAALRTKLISGSLRYARRQMRWFMHNTEIYWIKRPAEAENLLQKFLA